MKTRGCRTVFIVTLHGSAILSGICQKPVMSSQRPSQPIADVGTLWTMERGGRRARCAFVKAPGGWQVRTIVDNKILLMNDCDRPQDAFALAERWQREMCEHGWLRLVPSMTTALTDERA